MRLYKRRADHMITMSLKLLYNAVLVVVEVLVTLDLKIGEMKLKMMKNNQK